MEPYSVSKFLPFPNSNFNLRDYNDENDETIPCQTQGGILEDSKYVWLANGARFSVMNTKSRLKLASWTFGSVLKDSSTKVTCVDELQRLNGKVPLLIVGVECFLTGGVICIFDMISSKVIRAIQIGQKVTSLHVVDPGFDVYQVPGPLRAFDGILAVGTAGGDVILIDICRQAWQEALCGAVELKDEVDTCQLHVLYCDDVEYLETLKENAVSNGEHLAIHLNAVSDKITPHFVLKGPQGDDRVHVNRVEVVVSALHFCSQLGSLLVGYNFGAWQMWNIIDMTLLYTSPVYEENVPVSHFALQEPCDDPRAFCYVWAVYSNNAQNQSGSAVAALYSLQFDSKEWHEGYGYLYQYLRSCAVRLQTELCLRDEYIPDATVQSAHCLRLQSISKGLSKGNALQDAPEETMSLCAMIWNVTYTNGDVRTYLNLFDLNQWYKAQMPSSPQSSKCEPYMVCVCLTNLILSTGGGTMPLLDVRLDVNTLINFNGAQRLEEHYHPSSLAYECFVLRENNAGVITSHGNQRALLTCLEAGGSLALVRPSELYEHAIELGMTPLFVDLPLQSAASLNFQRELLLSMALEHQLVGWLCKCAFAWSNGSHSAASCSLDFLLSWGWKRAKVLKQYADSLTVPLFDYSGFQLDANTHKLLNHCVKQLKSLGTLFGFVVRKLYAFVSNGEIIKYQWNLVQMVSVHLEVLQWLLNVGLLPECCSSMYPRIDDYDRLSAPYPVDNLIEYYSDRRASLQLLNQESFSSNGSLLFIDNLIDFECGGQLLQNQWENDGGTGLYPPSSLQALLRTYLVDNIDISHKHCIIIYVFLDLAMTLDQDRYKTTITHLIKFPAVFQLSPSIIKITQAFWQLDHGDFSTAMEQLLDPLVSAGDLKIWHHRTALRALLSQGQHNFALLYLQVRQPPVTEVQDMCTVISLFIANGMLDDAFHFHRQNNGAGNEDLLLRHFFRESNRKGKLSLLLHLSLTPAEEVAFMQFLRDIKHPQVHDIQVFYHLQRFRYVDAFKLNDKFNIDRADGKGLLGKKNINFRDFVMQSFSDAMPSDSKTVLNVCRTEKSNLLQKGDKPEPMSVCINDTKKQAEYKSTFIYTGLVKAKETWTHSVLDRSLNNTKNNHTTTEDTPFFRTPTAVPPVSRVATPMVYPDITEVSDLDDMLATSPKRLKLSPRASSINDMVKSKSKSFEVSSASLLVQLDTPVVKRKTPKLSGLFTISNMTERYLIGTPHSILKVGGLGTGSTPAEATTSITASKDDTTDGTPAAGPALHMASQKNIARTIQFATPAMSSKASLGLTPRKALPRTPRPAVHFDMTLPSSSTSNTSDGDWEITQTTAQATTSSNESGLTAPRPKRNFNSSETSSRNSSLSTDEIYYSPNASVNANETTEKSKELEGFREVLKDRDDNLGIQITAEHVPVLDSPRRSSRVRRFSKTSTEVIPETAPAKLDERPSSPERETSSSNGPKTPRSRRSYRSNLEMPTRSSPRLKKFRVPDNIFEADEKEQKIYDTKDIAQLGKSTFEESALSQLSKSMLKQTPKKSLGLRHPDTPRPKISLIDEVPSPLLPKLTSRRSLSRQVLESNVLSSVPASPRSLRSSRNLSLVSDMEPKASRIETSFTKSENTFELKTTGGQVEVSHSVLREKSKDIFTNENDPKPRETIVQHMYTKSIKTSMGKLFEEAEDVEESPETHSSGDSNQSSAALPPEKTDETFVHGNNTTSTEKPVEDTKESPETSLTGSSDPFKIAASVFQSTLNKSNQIFKEKLDEEAIDAEEICQTSCSDGSRLFKFNRPPEEISETVQLNKFSKISMEKLDDNTENAEQSCESSFTGGSDAFIAAVLPKETAETAQPSCDEPSKIFIQKLDEKAKDAEDSLNASFSSSSGLFQAAAAVLQHTLDKSSIISKKQLVEEAAKSQETSSVLFNVGLVSEGTVEDVEEKTATGIFKEKEVAVVVSGSQPNVVAEESEVPTNNANTDEIISSEVGEEDSSGVTPNEVDHSSVNPENDGSDVISIDNSSLRDSTPESPVPSDILYEDLSNANYTTNDPEMNVFEISDDLGFNDGICIANGETLQGDASYVTSNDIEVFADEEVLSDLVPAVEENSNQFAIYEDQNQGIYDSSEQRQAPDEIIELSSGSDEMQSGGRSCSNSSSECAGRSDDDEEEAMGEEQDTEEDSNDQREENGSSYRGISTSEESSPEYDNIQDTEAEILAGRYEANLAQELLEERNLDQSNPKVKENQNQQPLAGDGNEETELDSRDILEICEAISVEVDDLPEIDNDNVVGAHKSEETLENAERVIDDAQIEKLQEESDCSPGIEVEPAAEEMLEIKVGEEQQANEEGKELCNVEITTSEATIKEPNVEETVNAYAPEEVEVSTSETGIKELGASKPKMQNDTENVIKMEEEIVHIDIPEDAVGSTTEGGIQGEVDVSQSETLKDEGCVTKGENLKDKEEMPVDTVSIEHENEGFEDNETEIGQKSVALGSEEQNLNIQRNNSEEESKYFQETVVFDHENITECSGEFEATNEMNIGFGDFSVVEDDDVIAEREEIQVSIRGIIGNLIHEHSITNVVTEENTATEKENIEVSIAENPGTLIHEAISIENVGVNEDIVAEKEAIVENPGNLLNKYTNTNTVVAEDIVTENEDMEVSIAEKIGNLVHEAMSTENSANKEIVVEKEALVENPGNLLNENITKTVVAEEDVVTDDADLDVSLAENAGNLVHEDISSKSEVADEVIVVEKKDAIVSNVENSANLISVDVITKSVVADAYIVAHKEDVEVLITCNPRNLLHEDNSNKYVVENEGIIAEKVDVEVPIVTNPENVIHENIQTTDEAGKKDDETPGVVIPIVTPLQVSSQDGEKPVYTIGNSESVSDENRTLEDLNRHQETFCVEMTDLSPPQRIETGKDEETQKVNEEVSSTTEDFEAEQKEVEDKLQIVGESGEKSAQIQNIPEEKSVEVNKTDEGTAVVLTKIVEGESVIPEQVAKTGLQVVDLEEHEKTKDSAVIIKEDSLDGRELSKIKIVPSIGCPEVMHTSEVSDSKKVPGSKAVSSRARKTQSRDSLERIFKTLEPVQSGRSLNYSDMDILEQINDSRTDKPLQNPPECDILEMDAIASTSGVKSGVKSRIVQKVADEKKHPSAALTQLKRTNTSSLTRDLPPAEKSGNTSKTVHKDIETETHASAAQSQVKSSSSAMKDLAPAVKSGSIGVETETRASASQNQAKSGSSATKDLAPAVKSKSKSQTVQKGVETETHASPARNQAKSGSSATKDLAPAMKSKSKGQTVQKALSQANSGNSAMSSLPPAEKIQDSGKAPAKSLKVLAGMRKRSASVEFEAEPIKKKRLTRSNSVDTTDKVGKLGAKQARKVQLLSVPGLEPIVEEDKVKELVEKLNPAVHKTIGRTKSEYESKIPKATKRAGRPRSVDIPKSEMEQYSTSRRLTRRQLQLLEKNKNTLKPTSVVSEDTDDDLFQQDERGPKISKIDPLVLLDRIAFKGKPDPEEAHILEKSPSSTITDRSTTPTRSMKLRSQDEPSSLTVDDSATMKRRVTRATSRTASEYSEQGTPTKQQRRTTQDQEEVAGDSPVSRSTRRRSVTKSVSSLASDDLEPLRRSARKSKIVATPDLPQISEDQSSVPLESQGTAVGKMPKRRRQPKGASSQ